MSVRDVLAHLTVRDLAAHLHRLPEAPATAPRDVEGAAAAALAGASPRELAELAVLLGPAGGGER